MLSVDCDRFRGQYRAGGPIQDQIGQICSFFPVGRSGIWTDLRGKRDDEIAIQQQRAILAGLNCVIEKRRESIPSSHHHHGVVSERIILIIHVI
jgi:hypothetical protein